MLFDEESDLFVGDFAEQRPGHVPCKQIDHRAQRGQRARHPQPGVGAVEIIEHHEQDEDADRFHQHNRQALQRSRALPGAADGVDAMGKLGVVGHGGDRNGDWTG